MAGSDYKVNERKWRYTLMTTVLFLVIVHPMTYRLTHSIFKGLFKVAGKSGCPTTAGYLLHAVVFTLLLRAMMDSE